MSFWSSFTNVLTGGLSGLFTSGGSNSASSFLSDPLGYGARDESQRLARGQFDFQKDSWNKEYELQQQQFDYQKWYDQNNVTLGLKQNMEAGINPMAAQGGANSSVTASASPQSPSTQFNGSANTGIIGDIFSQLGQNARSKLSADVARDEIGSREEIARKELASQQQFQTEYLKILKDKVRNENTRTSAYANESNARTNQLLNDLEKALEGEYGRNSSYPKKILGELKDALSKRVANAQSYVDSLAPEDSTSNSAPKSASAPSRSTSDDWDAYLAAKASAAKSGYHLTYDEWRGRK